MKNQRTVVFLTCVNFGFLIFLVMHQTTPVKADSATTVLRVRALEIVDTQGRLRASLQVIPEGPARRPDGSAAEQSGKVYPEAVVFRLIRPDGRPSVKIATTEQGSGIDLSGGIDPTYIVLSSEAGEASITLTNKDGHHQVVKP